MKILMLFTIFLCCVATGFSQSKSKRKSPATIIAPSRQDSIMSSLIIGKWTDQNSTLQFLSTGNYSIVYDFDYQHLPNKGTWQIEGNRLLLNFSRQKTIDGVRPQYSDLYDILYFSPARFEYRLSDIKSDSTVWIAHKVMQKD